MSGIRGKDTKPELVVRKGLHALGLRFRLHVKNLPGSPDLVFPKYRTVIFVHGCFWHGHDCPAFKWPKTRPDFWKQKIEANKARDRHQSKVLEETGWRVLRVWECEVKSARKTGLDAFIKRLAESVASSIA